MFNSVSLRSHILPTRLRSVGGSANNKGLAIIQSTSTRFAPTSACASAEGRPLGADLRNPGIELV